MITEGVHIFRKIFSLSKNEARQGEEEKLWIFQLTVEPEGKWKSLRILALVGSKLEVINNPKMHGTLTFIGSSGAVH